nr:retrovirus-related Pol polyprotein from transposon TNT 1-94 [Tanacetum cinerariifolium]
MESLNPQVVSAAKLPILNPNEFNLWKMRIEQYFLMTNYSLWEVILNGDSPTPIRVIEGVLQPVTPTTTEQSLARKNELKARGTLLMALPDQHQLKFNTHKDAKTLMEAIEKSTNELVSATASVYAVSAKIPISALPNVDSLSNVVIYSFFASQSNSSQLDNDDLKQIDADDLEEIDLKWQMARLTVRARRFLQRTGRNLGTNRPTSMGFDMSKVECYNCHRKRHLARKCRSSKDTRRNRAAEPQRRNVPVETSTSNALVSQCDGMGSYDWIFQAEEEPTNYDHMAFSSLSYSSENESALNKTLEKAEQERNDLKLKLEKFQTSSKNLSELLASQTNDKTGLGYNSQVFTRAMFDYDNYLSSRSDEILPPCPIYDRYQSGNRYHVVPPPYTGTFMPPKPDLVFNNTPTNVETDHPAFHVKLSPTRPDQDLSHTYRPSAPIIKDWVSNLEDESETQTLQNVPNFVQPRKPIKTPRNRKACFVCKSLDHLIKDSSYNEKKMTQTTPRNTSQRGTHKKYAQMTLPYPHMHVVPAAVLPQSKLVPINAVRPVSSIVPKISVTRPRQAKTIVTKPNSPPRTHINHIPSHKAGNCPLKVTAVKAPMVNAAQGNPQHALKDKGVIDSGCSRHMTGNMSYLFDFEELNGGYVAFGRNPKGGKISRKGKIRTGKLDFDDVYFVKGKQHRASCKTKPVSSVNQPLYRLHMDLFGPTFVKIPNKKSYCLVVTDDYSTFTWVFFLATKDETSPILKTFITGLENQLSLKVKVIRSDNGTEFKNNDLNQFFKMKGIKREFSVPKTPQQNGIAERKIRTLIEAARTILLDSLLPILFWAEAVNTACYVQNRVLVTKPHNKTPYGLLHGRTPSIGFMRPFGCLVTILNTLDSLGKFDGKVDEGFLVGYSISSKAFRVFNSRTRIVQETLHVNFLENKPNVTGNQSNPSAGVQEQFDVEKAWEEIEQQYVFFLVWSYGFINPQNIDGDTVFNEKEPEFVEKKPESEINVSLSSSAQSKKHDDKTKREAKGKSPVESLTGYRNLSPEFEDFSDNNINEDNAAELEDFTYSDDQDDVGAEADFNNLETSITVSPIRTTRFHKDHHDFRNKKDERGIVVRNKARLVAQGHTQEEGIDYEEVFAPVARIEAIRLFLDYASFMGFMVYQMNVKSAFLYGTIEEEVYVCQPPGFENPDYLTRYGKSASTPIDTEKPLLKDPNGFGLTMQVVLSGMKSLKRMLHVTNILSGDSLTSQQMVLNSPCLTDIKNWLVQNKQSLVASPCRQKKVVITEASIRDALHLDDAEASLGERLGEAWCCSEFIERLDSDQSSNPTSSTNPKGRNRRRSKKMIVNFNLEEHSPPVVTMDDQHTMAQLLQAPTEGYEDAVVVPAITADNFELKHGLLTLVQNKQFFGHDKEDPHAHIRYFNKITSTLKFPNVLNTSIKLMLFPFSLEGAARIWLEKELPRSIFTWDDLVSKFINQFLPPSKTTSLHNEITNFQQRFDESFSEAWDRFKDLFRACPHHGLSELHQLDTFYNTLNSKDQDSLNSAAGGNFLDKMPCECLAIIESKSKVRYSRDKPIVAKVSTNASTYGVSPDVAELKDMVKALLLDKKATDGNIYHDNIQEFISQASAVNYNQGNTSYRPPMMSNQIQPPGFPPAHAYQDPDPQTQGVSKEDFSTNVKANDAVMKNMQTQALVDLGASINLMPFSIWKRLSLPDLTPTCMTLELADRLISRPVGVAEDVYVKEGSYHFSADFIVVDFDADPRVRLILGRSFLKTRRALIDVFKGELTLRVGKEAITFNLDQTSRYSANYSDITAKCNDVIDMACEEYSQEVVGFSDTISSGNPTPYHDPIVFATSPTLTPFGNNDFLLEEGDILLLEAFLNDYPSLPPPIQRNYLPEVRKELKIYEAKSNKSSVDEPPVVELKALPPHLEYAFLEVDGKLPVIIAKDLSMEEKTALISVLKSHKRAIAWKLSDIKGINPEFCTHKILMEKDFTLAVQHQRRVNPKIHDVIKQEQCNLLSSGISFLLAMGTFFTGSGNFSWQWELHNWQ